MIKWTVINGIGQRNTVTCRATSGQPIPLSGAENFNCYYWTGQTQAAAGSLVWAYNTPAAGMVDITITPATAATLTLGLYQWVLELPDQSAAYARGQFEVTAGPGAATSATAPYCQYQDLLEYAPWIRQLGTETDLAGFLDKRISARTWLDYVVVRSWRGTSQAYFGDSGRTAQFWMGGWVRRAPISSAWLLDWIQGTNITGSNPGLVQGLMIRPWVIRSTAYRTLGYIGHAQIGINNQYASYGQYYTDLADETIFSQWAELDLTGSGMAQFGVPLGATNTLFT